MLLCICFAFAIVALISIRVRRLHGVKKTGRQSSKVGKPARCLIFLASFPLWKKISAKNVSFLASAEKLISGKANFARHIFQHTVKYASAIDAINLHAYA